MGIIINALSISFGALLGSTFKSRVVLKNFSALGISIMLISFVGLIENVFGISQSKLVSNNLMIVVFSLIIGSIIGEALHIDEKINNFSKGDKLSFNAFTDATLFFGIGGLQISGPIILALSGDNNQLFLKSIIDFPFAIMFGASYGISASLSALPVAAAQVLIFILSNYAGNFLTGSVIAQICSMGYIVLFFSGFNLICEKKNKINNTNMIPGILIVLLFNIIGNIWRSVL